MKLTYSPTHLLTYSPTHLLKTEFFAMQHTRIFLAVAALTLSGSAIAGKPLFLGQSNPSVAASKAAQGLANQPQAINVRLMRADSSAVSKNNQEITLDLGFETVNAELDRATETKLGSLVWSGHLKDVGSKRVASGNEARRDEQNSAILVRRGDGITGSVRLHGKLYQITPLGDGTHAVTEVNESRMPADHSPNSADVKVGSPRSQADALALATGNSVIRVSTFASSEAIAAYAGDMQALVELAVAETNQGYANSGVNITLELAGYTPVTYTESTNFDINLDRFAGTNDGYMDGIHATRDTQGGDVAALMVKNSAYCGVADAIGATSSTAYVLVSRTCATGYYSFAHEIGHLQGARHDAAHDSSSTPYPYGHGFQAADRSFRTIMAYDCKGQGCPRLNYWSNPGVTYDGMAMGTTTKNDNHRALNNSAASVAAFKP